MFTLNDPSADSVLYYLNTFLNLVGHTKGITRSSQEHGPKSLVDFFGHASIGKYYSYYQRRLSVPILEKAAARLTCIGTPREMARLVTDTGKRQQRDSHIIFPHRRRPWC